MIPGNHDFFYYGNTLGSKSDHALTIRRAWVDACDDEDYPPNRDVDLQNPPTVLTKIKFIRNYLARIVAH